MNCFRKLANPIPGSAALAAAILLELAAHGHGGRTTHTG